MRTSVRALSVAFLSASLTVGVAGGAVTPASASQQSTDAQKVAALMKRAVAVQTEFVSGAVAYERAAGAAVKAEQAATAAQKVADAATKRGDAARAELGRYAAAMYTGGGIGPDQPLVGVITLLTDPNPEKALHSQAVVEYLADQRGSRVNALIKVREEAKAAAEVAVAAHHRAQVAQAAATHVLDGIQDKADLLAVEIDEALAKVGNTGGLVSAEQTALNQAAKDSWATYTKSLSDARIVAPKATALVDPAHLPAGMTPVLGEDGKPIPGIANRQVGKVQVKVLAAQTITAVTGALRQIGKPYVPDQSGPEAFDCGGLTSAMWAQAGVPFSPAVDTQWVTGARVPVNQVQPGDLVFLSDPTAGLHHVGIVVAPSLMVAASSRTFMVGVQMVPPDAFGAVRPTLPATKVNTVPASNGEPMRCGSSDELPSLEESKPDVALVAGGSFAPPSRSGRAWGGYANGMIPAGALCPIGGGSERLRCDAAKAFNAMDAAFKKSMKSSICISDGYRSYPDQIRVFRERPGLAAVPGTSNHGWGLATDLGCGINSFSSPAHAWMKANAAKFGFFHPGWAEPGGSKPEPWHWEFGRIS